MNIEDNRRARFEKWCKDNCSVTDFSFEQFDHKFYRYNDALVELLFTGYRAAAEESTSEEALALQARVLQLEVTLGQMCCGLKWNIDEHPTVMNESDAEMLTEALAVLSAPPKAMLPVGEMACDARTGHVLNILWSGTAQPIGTKLYIKGEPA